jgi:hypothetical protein
MVQKRSYFPFMPRLPNAIFRPFHGLCNLLRSVPGLPVGHPWLYAIAPFRGSRTAHCLRFWEGSAAAEVTNCGQPIAPFIPTYMRLKSAIEICWLNYSGFQSHVTAGLMSFQGCSWLIELQSRIRLSGVDVVGGDICRSFRAPISFRT